MQKKKEHLGQLDPCKDGGRKSFFPNTEHDFISVFHGAEASAQNCKYVQSEDQYYCEIDVKKNVCYIDGNNPGVQTKRVLFIISKGNNGKITFLYPWKR